MGTAVSEIITDNAMVEIDDERLRRQLQENPALFFRRMWLYVKNAVPIFSNPPEMRERLAYTAPEFADCTWTAEASSEPTVVPTGKTGYELMSVQINEIADGQVISIPYDKATYDAESGNVTFPAGIPDGTFFQIDFYTDGQFENELTYEERRILTLCIALVWYERFETNWLNMQPKVSSKSFSVGSESNHIRAMSERTAARRAALFSEMNRYAQDVAYRTHFANGRYGNSTVF